MNSSIKIALVFFAFGVAWIYFTGIYILNLTGKNLDLYHKIEIFKGIIFIIFSAGLIYFVSKHLNRSLDKANDELKLKNQQISLMAEEKVSYHKELTHAILRAEEEERKQIGAELHDNISQILATTKLYLNLAFENHSLREELIKKSADNILEVITELRKLSKSLNPATLVDVGLLPSLEDLAGHIRNSKQIKIDLYSSNFAEDKVAKDTKQIIFRIVQEQLNNILRYSNAKQIIIELENSPGMMGLTIQDDGKGIDTRNGSMNSILTSIRNRTELFNGTMNVISSPGNGCTLRIEIEDTGKINDHTR
jgi:two-component system sensor histidine kinase UhpB